MTPPDSAMNGLLPPTHRPVRPRDWSQVGISTLVYLAVTAIALFLAGYGWTGWEHMPVAIRLATGLIAFGLSPGLFIAGTLVLPRQRDIGFADFVHAVFTCSFSCNLLFNLTLYLWPQSFAGLAHSYLLVQASCYVLWAILALRRQPSESHLNEPRKRQPWAAVLSGLALVAAASLLVYIAYANGSEPTNPEELVSLRKLAQNPVVRYDNITFRDHEPSTYFFVPFQVFIVGTSLLAHLDVALTYSVFWCVTTLLSLVVLTRFAYVLFGRIEIAGIACFLMASLGIFAPSSLFNDAGIVTPFPNRYGFGSGVLLPLGLLWLWSILRESNAHVWRWALLIYLVIETTFVRARETLISMGTMLALLVLLIAHAERHRRTLIRLGDVLAIMGLVLMVYKAFNLWMSPGLSGYLDNLSSQSLVAMNQMFSDLGRWRAFVTEPPHSIAIGAGSSGFSVDIIGYRRLFVEPWADPDYAGRLFLPLAMLALPLYALRAKSLLQLTLALIMAGLGVITASGPAVLYLSALIGNPEVFQAHAIVFIVSFFIVADALFSCGLSASSLCRTRPRLWIPSTVALVGFVGGAYALPDHIDRWRIAGAALWSPTFSWSLILATIAAVCYRLRQRDLPLFPDVPWQGASVAGACVAWSLAAIIVAPAIRSSEVWSGRTLRPVSPSGQFSGDLVQDYDRLVATDKLYRQIPVSVIRYFRAQVAPNSVILGQDTLALMMAAPHFAAVVSVDGAVMPNYIDNVAFLQNYSRTKDKTFSVMSYLSDMRGRSTFTRMLRECGGDYLIVAPAESKAADQIIETDPNLSIGLRKTFSADEFVVYDTRRIPRT